MKLWWQNVQKKKGVIDNHMYKECESTCYECTSKDEVEHYKEDIVVFEGRINQKKDMEQDGI